jgi:HTH-type transcriptional regulator / antitoxin HigA
MAIEQGYAYKPDYAVPPGESLVEALEALGMTQAELASRMGRPLKTVNEIVKGKAAITADTSLQLERVLGIPASFWINLERGYREALARAKDAERLQSELAWPKQFPLGAMVKAQWIQAGKGVEQLRELLRFFGVASPEQWRELWSAPGVAYRQSAVFKSNPAAVSAWLRVGELRAQQIQCEPYDAKKFRQALEDMRTLSAEPPETFQPELRRLCMRCGVALVFVPELPGLRVSGATRWLSATKALIQLSLRYKSNDHLWFSVFHEAGHVLLHGKRRVFIEDGGGDKAKEEEANAFAANLLIPPQSLQRFLSRGDLGERAIIRFAESVGVAPGIVVGRLQHDKVIEYKTFNELKRWFEWKTESQSRSAA